MQVRHFESGRIARLSGAVVVGVLVGLLTLPAVGLSRSTRAVARADRPWLPPAGKAEKMVSVKTTSGRELSLWRWQTAAGGECVSTHLGTTPAQAPSQLNGGGGCDVGRAGLQGEPILATVSWVAVDGDLAVFVFGHVAPGLGIAGFDLATPGGTSPLHFSGRYFAGELPGEAAVEVGSLAPGPYVLIAYDMHDNEVARLDLNELVRRATPSS